MKDSRKEKMPKRDDNIYVKMANGRYRPYGVRYEEPYMLDGVWYVRHHENSVSTTNVDYMCGLYRVGDKPQKLDIQKVCAMEDYKDYVLNSKEIKEIMDNGCYSWNELVAKITALVVDLNEKYQKRK